MNEKVVNAALLGLGTVGTGVYKVIKSQEQEMTAKLGCQVKITKILVRNLEKASGKVDDPSVLTTDWADIEGDPSIDIVIELIGGIEPARTYILAALKAGKNVVTANKDLIAVHGKEILETARAAQKDFLTKMSQEGMEFSDALALATELGYAEADPTADIEGIDAGRKVAILASVAFNSRVTLDNVHIEGITKITAKDIRYAKEMGCEIKLLGVARCQEDGVEAYVCPMLIPAEHPLASVNDSYNAVFVHGDAVGDTMFYGRGAGELPTASAVAGDVFEVVRNMKADCCGRVGCTCYKTLPVKNMADTHNRYFLRLQVEDRCGVLAEILEHFAKYQASVAQIMQKESKRPDTAEVVVITKLVSEGAFFKVKEELENSASVRKISSMIRVYQK